MDRRQKILELLTQALPSKVNSAKTYLELPDEVTAWERDIVSGVLRHKGFLEYVLDSYITSKRPTGDFRKILLMGCYQLLIQTQAEAPKVVSETVSFVKSKVGEGPSKFTNAVLRKILDQKEKWKQASSAVSQKDPLKTQEALLSISPWIYQKLLSDYGFEWSKRFLLNTLKRPEFWLKYSSGESHVAPWSGDPKTWPEYEKGSWIIQDISSQNLISEVCEALKSLGCGDFKKMQVLDLCASPGGKATHLGWRGFSVVASDGPKKSERLKLLKQTCARTKAFEVCEELSPNHKAAFDLVWVDAPCTGVGTLQKHPEIRWNLAEAQLNEVSALQKKLIEEGASYVKPGGFLVYSVCSVFKDEGEHQLKEVPQNFVLQKTWMFGDSDQGEGFFGAFFQKTSDV